MSQRPAAKSVICATEPVVACNSIARSSRAKYPFSCATKMGQLNPPGNTLTRNNDAIGLILACGLGHGFRIEEKAQHDAGETGRTELDVTRDHPAELGGKPGDTVARDGSRSIEAGHEHAGRTSRKRGRDR